MEEITRADGMATQRELAKTLGVSLGLANAFVKRVVKKGYFKVTTIPGKRVRYLLTPTGFVEKSRLTVQYLHYSLNFYRRVHGILKDTMAHLRARGIRRVAVIGTGELAELTCLFLREAALEVALVASDNGAGRVLGYPVQPMAALAENTDYDLICVVDLKETWKILSRLKEVGISKEQILIGVGAK